MINKNTILSLVIFLFVITSLNEVSAGFALGTPYRIEGNAGESHLELISIQNLIEPTTDATFEITIITGSEYISFPDGQRIDVKANESKNIEMLVSIPKKSKPEQIYESAIIVKQIAGQSATQGTVGLSVSLGETFKIHVNGEKQNSKVIIISIVLGILIILLIWLLIKTLRSKK